MSRLVGFSLGAVAGAAAVTMASPSLRARRTYWRTVDSIVMPLLRYVDPENAHTLSILALKARLAPVDASAPRERLACEFFGRKLSSPLMMAAGYDKQADVYNALFDMGLAGVEVGGVTPFPQDGNPKPRMWRIPEKHAVINRFGLNSEGHASVKAKLSSSPPKGLLLVNVAKNTVGGSLEDFLIGYKEFSSISDGVVLNVSCPNVRWQGSLDETRALLEAVFAERQQHHGRVLLKVSPDSSDQALEELCAIALELKIDALVVANTTSLREDDDVVDPNYAQNGGLSGGPLKSKANEACKKVYRFTNGSIPIVGVGGIETGMDAYERIRAGASVIQIYTGMVYRGVSIVPDVKRELDACLLRDGFSSVSDAVGVDARG